MMSGESSIYLIFAMFYLYAFERDGPKTRFYKKETLNLRLNLIEEDLEETKIEMGKT